MTTKIGFAAMNPEKQRQISSRGGKAAHLRGKAHEFSREEARQAGKKGGASISRDVEHMRAIGRKGGAAVSRDVGHMAEIGRKGGLAVSADSGHMREIGRKGGAE